MPGIEDRLAELGLQIPAAPKPVAAYIPTVRSGSLVFVSGQLPFQDGQLMATGRLDGEVSLEQAQACARQCVLNGLAALKGEIGSLDAVRRVVRVGCWVACGQGFTDQPKVANGASELLQEIFGEKGRHARAAVGSIALPLGAPVEIEFLFEVE
ncbi:MAG: RidA family protein [Phycisphaeraceae bacterium]|nr:MAG: RidA family protein [Phycisphaeraceae bacterium]